MQRNNILLKGLDWGLYDFANSGYYLVYSLLFFPLYLATHALKGDPWFEVKWGMAQGISVVVSVAFGLLLGPSLDAIGIRRVARITTLAPAAGSLLFPLLIALNVSGNILILAYCVIHGLYLLSLTVYDATLTHVARGNMSIKISGWAWGWGYVGGLTCMAIMQLGLLLYDRYSPWDFLAASLFFLVFSVIATSRMSKRLAATLHAPAQSPMPDDMQSPMTRIPRWQLLLVFLLIVDGIAVFLAFFSLYGTKVAGLDEPELTKMLAVLQVLAFPLTGLVCSQADRGWSLLLWFCAITWAVTCGLIVAFPGAATIWVAVILAASVVGSTQALLRAIYANTVTPETSIKGFSVYALVEKGAAFAGPVLAGWLVVFVGYRFVFGLAAALIVAGCGILAQMHKKGAQNAQDCDQRPTKLQRLQPTDDQ